jgi:NADPH2:quinone reductase
MKALVQERFGEPGDVLQLRDVPEVSPGRGEVRVRMKLSPINPSDLMRVQGSYDNLPPLPATPGFEGVGVIDAAGPGWIATLRGLRPGRRVAVLASGGGSWQQQLVLSARHVVPVPDDIPDEQVASFFVNPATVIAMASHLLQVPAGAFLLQSAAGSSLGKMLIRYAKHQGFATINLVRRREQGRSFAAPAPSM